MGRYLIKQCVGLALLAGALFVSAGTLRWPMGWGYIGLCAASMALTGILLARHSPDLVQERAGVRAGTKGYDVPLALAMAYAPMLMGVAAGLQVRFGTTVDMAWGWWAAVAALALGSTAWTLWAMLSNPFFAPVVRIQSERGHSVAADGPYRYVRHPGYLGAVLFALATPALLGSSWAATLLALLLPAYVLRTALEDRVLRAELPGYAGYARDVCYRLVPGVW